MNKSLDKFIHSRLFIIILIGIFSLTTVLVGTYAWLTWNSADNTSFVMTVGDLADIYFSDGNEMTGNLNPVFNYKDGLSTSFTIDNISDSTGSGYDINFNITSIDAELISDDVKFVVVKNNEIVSTGDLYNSGAANGTTIVLHTDVFETGIVSYTIYLYIDANVENDINMTGKSIVGNITVVTSGSSVTPLSNFMYVLGSETPILTEIDYNGDSVHFPSIELAENEVLLLKYIGDSAEVTVPSNYTVDGINYSVTALSRHTYVHDDWDNNSHFGVEFGVFYENAAIESVTFADKVKLMYVSYVTGIDSGITYVGEEIVLNDSAGQLFRDCKNLSYAKLPSSITDMDSTFYGCTSLVTVPELPSSVTIMSFTFRGCTSLVTVPELPSSVADMTWTFGGCTNLITVPKIPSSVSNMFCTFYGCTNLTGIVRISSSNVSEVINVFYGTSKSITVEVPAGSTTHTQLSALTTSNGMPSNVTLNIY